MVSSSGEHLVPCRGEVSAAHSSTVEVLALAGEEGGGPSASPEGPGAATELTSSAPIQVPHPMSPGPRSSRSAQAAITKYHRPSGLNNRLSFSYSCQDWKHQDQGAG